MPHGKNYRNALKEYDVLKEYSLAEAVEIIPKTTTTNFDSTVEIHLNLGIDPKQADQQIRGTLALPHGTGKSVKIAAFVTDDKVQEAKDAGADFVGGEEMIEKVASKGWTDFDIAISTPDMMRQMAKIGKVLGTKGLMPNPKAGTVTSDVKKTVEDIKKGRVEYRNDPQGIVHGIVGKVSFGPEKLGENVDTFLKQIQSIRPASLKGTYINSVTLTTAMGPGVRVNVSNS